MSFILKGIDLPKEKVETIEVIFRCEEDGSLYSIRELLEPTQAIQIPKGARLIDANELIADHKKRMDDDWWKDHAPASWWDALNSEIRRLGYIPTILESEVMPNE